MPSINNTAHNIKKLTCSQHLQFSKAVFSYDLFCTKTRFDCRSYLFGVIIHSQNDLLHGLSIFNNSVKNSLPVYTFDSPILQTLNQAIASRPSHCKTHFQLSCSPRLYYTY